MLIKRIMSNRIHSSGFPWAYRSVDLLLQDGDRELRLDTHWLMDTENMCTYEAQREKLLLQNGIPLHYSYEDNKDFLLLGLIKDQTSTKQVEVFLFKKMASSTPVLSSVTIIGSQYKEVVNTFQKWTESYEIYDSFFIKKPFV